MLDNLGKNAASKKFVRAYDRYTVALCGAALVAYGAQQYFVRLLVVVPANRLAPAPSDRVRELVPSLAVPRTHRPRSSPRAAQGWDDAPSAIPKEVPVPKAEKGGAEKVGAER